jgi:hypothetical protein
VRDDAWRLATAGGIDGAGARGGGEVKNGSTDEGMKKERMDGDDDNDDDDDDDGGGSDSEESALIVWEDGASDVADLRHLLQNGDDDDEDGNGNGRPDRAGGERSRCVDVDDGTARRGDAGRGCDRTRDRLPIAMTQQIEMLSFDDDDDDDDDDDECGGASSVDVDGGENDNGDDVEARDGNGDRRDGETNNGYGEKTMTTTVTKTTTNIDNQSLSSSTASAGRDGTNASRGRGGRGGTRRRRLANDSGETPATIGKLRGRKRGRRLGEEGGARGGGDVADYDPVDAIAIANDGRCPFPSSPYSALSPVDENPAYDVDDADDDDDDERRGKERRKSARRDVARRDDPTSNGSRSNTMPILPARRRRERLPRSSLSQQSTGEGHDDRPTCHLPLRRSHTHPPPQRYQWQRRRSDVKEGGVANNDGDDGGGDNEGRFDGRIHSKLSSSSSSLSSTSRGRNITIGNVGSERSHNTTRVVDEDDKRRSDLFRQIELGLDRAWAGEMNAGPTPTTPAFTAIVRSEAVAALTTTTSRTIEAAKALVVASGCGIEEVSSYRAEVSMMASGASTTAIPVTNGVSTNAPTAANAGITFDNFSGTTNSKNISDGKDVLANCDDYYDNDEEWDEDDLAAIDLSVAAQQRQSQQHEQHLASVITTSVDPDSAAPSLFDSGDGEDCDDELWNDDDLAAIDLSVKALTQRRVSYDHNISTRSSNNTADVAPQNSTNITGGEVLEGGFDDDNCLFSDVDFDALDDAIVQQQQQRQKLLTSQQQEQCDDIILQSTSRSLSSSRPPSYLPTLAPIRNRCRRHSIVRETDGPQHQQVESSSPSYMSFTRYIVQTVQEDLATHTKTIGVSLWKDNRKLDDELDRLEKICSPKDINSSCMRNDINANIVQGHMYLRGEWFYAPCHVGDVVHLCSLSGDYATDVSALPVLLHSHHSDDDDDDLMLVLHPDELISPTIVSDAVQCPRLAVLKMRLGSTGLSSKSAVYGILRHELFQRCITSRDASHKSAALYTRQIIRENSEALIGCGITDRGDAFSEIIKTLPQVQRFLTEYTAWKDITKPSDQQKENQHPQQKTNECDRYTTIAAVPRAVLKGTFASYDTLMEVTGVYSTEECAYVPELGLKGYVDATVIARTKPLNLPMILSLPPSSSSSSTSCTTSQAGVQESLLPLELKTGHSQNPSHNHLAQLTMYTIMLRTRHGSCSNSRVHDDNCNVEGIGAAHSGMLLYLNHEGYRAIHVKPTLSDVKTLVGTRNSVVCDVIRASRPRGIAIKYDDDDEMKSNGARRRRSRVLAEEPPPPSALPKLQTSISLCERCFNNRECMMYTAADTIPPRNIGSLAELSLPLKESKILSHGKLLSHFTGHLTREDLEYFRKWDRLIDIERHASMREVTSKSWLFKSDEKEMRDGNCMSSLVLDEVALFSTEFDDQIKDTDDVSIRLVRSNDSAHTTPLSKLSFDVGDIVIVSDDGASFDMVKNGPTLHSRQMREIRHRIHILRGTIIRVGENNVDISVPSKDVNRLKRLVKISDGLTSRRKLRIDKDENGGSLFGLLLQNLINFFTLDIPSFSAESLGTAAKTKSLTMNSMQSARRRRLNSFIVRLEPHPLFRSVSSDSLFNGDLFALDVAGCDMISLKRDFDRLNSDQVRRFF